jgi:uncharacterized YigZ family protein
MSGFTLAASAEYLLETRQSRFLAQASPIDSIEHAMTLLDIARRQSATHHCWAYKSGLNYRFSDHGEPSGTAGKPILAAIEGQGLDAVMLIVIRWYGGINLGTGGLVRAYGGAASECLRQAERRPLTQCLELRLECDFSLSATVHLLLQHYQAEKLQESYSEQGMQLHFRIPAQYLSAITTKMNDVSRGTVRLSSCDNTTHEHTRT